MLTDLFLTVLNLSFAGSIAIVVVLAVRLLLRRAPKVFSQILWALVCLRLLCPISLESPVSLMPQNTAPANQALLFSESPQINTGLAPFDGAINRILPQPMPGASVNPLQIYSSLGAFLWLTGLLAFALYNIISLAKLRRGLRDAQPLGGNLYRSPLATSPFVLGLWRPRIYLPPGLSPQQEEYILLHERTHIRRGDHCTRLLGLVALGIHWFNPLCWLAFACFCRDTELSCDESVVHHLGSQSKQPYSHTLLLVTAGGSHPAPLAFGESNPKGRIRNILRYRPPAKGLALVLALALCLVALALATNAKATPESYAESYVWHEIQSYNNSPVWGFQVVDSRITRLECLTRVPDLLPGQRVELWALEYALKPDDPSKVLLAGGMEMEDGWLRETSSMGSPILVLSSKNGSLEYLGAFWSGEVGQTQSGLEVFAGHFLEQQGIFPQDFAVENKLAAHFTLSNQSTGTLLLSQPKGYDFWWVERWADDKENQYFTDPNANLSLQEYFALEDSAYRNNASPWLGDPQQVAQLYLKRDLYWDVPPANITLSPISLKDFLATYTGQ